MSKKQEITRIKSLLSDCWQGQRKRYTKEAITQAVEWFRSSDMTIEDAARTLDLLPQTFKRWIKDQGAADPSLPSFELYDQDGEAKAKIDDAFEDDPSEDIPSEDNQGERIESHHINGEMITFRHTSGSVFTGSINAIVELTSRIGL